MAGLYKGRASGGSEAQPQLRLFPPFKYHSNKKQKPLFLIFIWQWLVGERLWRYCGQVDVRFSVVQTNSTAISEGDLNLEPAGPKVLSHGVWEWDLAAACGTERCQPERQTPLCQLDYGFRSGWR